MGYQTYFNGEIKLDKPLTAAHIKIIEDFNDERHEDSKFPGVWCQWKPNEDGTAIVWDQNEKFYEYIAWMKYLIEHYLKPWGYIGNGSIEWNGEEADDYGVIDVVYNVVTSYNVHQRGNQIEEGLDKILALVPEKLPLLMGINEAMDIKVKALLNAGAATKKDSETEE